jgi:hypothetical protein
MACGLAPMMVCGEEDTDPDDDSFFGYTLGAVQMLKTSSQTDGDSAVGPGNFQLIRLGDEQGGAAVRDNLAGSYEDCISSSDTVPTEPGNTVGPVAQGLNTRFGLYSGPVDQSLYKPDYVTTANEAPIETDASGTVTTSAGDLTYAYGNPSDPLSQPSTYLYDYATMNYTDPPPLGEHERRILTVPIGDCSGTTNGQGDVPLYGFGCFFLLQPASQKGNEAEVYGQFVDDCGVRGFADRDPGTGPGPYTIVLFKDPDSVDS